MFSRTIRVVRQGKEEENEVLCLFFMFFCTFWIFQVSAYIATVWY